MGIRCELEEIFSFSYRIEFPNGLTENEFDHVLIGKSDDQPKPDPKEVEQWRWVGLKALRTEIRKNPEIYTYWFKILIEKLPEKFT
jgi:isopentenyl-diphosphate delta-isomerase